MARGGSPLPPLANMATSTIDPGILASGVSGTAKDEPPKLWQAMERVWDPTPIPLKDWGRRSFPSKDSGTLRLISKERIDDKPSKEYFLYSCNLSQRAG